MPRKKAAKKKPAPTPEATSLEGTSDVPQPSPVTVAPPVRGVRLCVRRDCALGNGTRKSGEVLATVTLEDGVEFSEIEALFRNPQLLKRQ